MHMKHLGLLLLLLLSIPAHALLVSVNGYGDIPAEGMQIELTELEEDILTGDLMFKLDGSLLSTNPLTVTITRSETNIADEFCCAGQCTAGNGETSEQLEFTPNGMANWYVHLTPDGIFGSYTITYTFSDGTESRTLTVRYIDAADAIEIINHKSEITNRKVLRDGIIYIETETNIYHL